MQVCNAISDPEEPMRQCSRPFENMLLTNWASSKLTLTSVLKSFGTENATFYEDESLPFMTTDNPYKLICLC